MPFYAPGAAAKKKPEILPKNFIKPIDRTLDSSSVHFLKMRLLLGWIAGATATCEKKEF